MNKSKSGTCPSGLVPRFCSSFFRVSSPEPRVPFFWSVTSGILLTLSYPKTSWGFLAWIALVPLLFAIRQAKSVSHALGYGFVCGLFFFGCSMHWLIHVTSVGWVLWMLSQALFILAFGGLVYFSNTRPVSLPVRILWTSAAWTVLEMARSEIPVLGVGWNLLAYSQAAYPSMIQAANIFGAYGLSFVIAVVNACAFELIRGQADFLGTVPGSRDRPFRKNQPVPLLFAAVVVILGTLFFYGNRSLAKTTQPEEYLRVSVLQGNIPQSVKWQLMAKETIIEIYTKLTQLAGTEQPDLIIWPEASFPGYFNTDLQAPRILALAKEVEAPLLVGGLHWVVDREVYNSAYLVNKNGILENRYDKLRLVPFGEYIPFKFFLGWLTPVAEALGISDFSFGKDLVIFQWARAEWPFGVLICFEDAFSDLARHYADRGAKFLTVITNDAWFGRTGAPFQHFDASIFRAVENGVAVVRAANTGVSGFISYRGEVLATVSDKSGEETFMLGHKTLDLPLVTKETWYRRGGYLFPCFIFLLFLGLGTLLIKKKTVRINNS